MLTGGLNALKKFVTFAGKPYWLTPCISTAARNFIYDTTAVPVNLSR